MKRLSAIILLLLFLFNIFGYYLVFSYNQYILKTEITGLIKSHHFDQAYTILTIASPLLNKDYIRLNKDEFRYKGELYDIISEEMKNGFLTIRCIADKLEDNLISCFSRSQEFANGQNNPANSKHASVMRYLIITLALIETSADQPQRFSKELKFSLMMSPLLTFINPPDSPPPKLS